MKKITILTKQTVFLEGFGAINFHEATDGAWEIDLFPREYEGNSPDKLRIETSFKHTGDKYFQYVDTVRDKLKKFGSRFPV